MLPAIGASVALDALQSMTSPSGSSQATGSGGFDLDDGPDISPPVSSPVSGHSSAQISSGNFNALLDAQSLDSGDLTSGGSSSDSSQSQSGTSAYNAVNQLVQSTAIPIGFSPVSISA